MRIYCLGSCSCKTCSVYSTRDLNRVFHLCCLLPEFTVKSFVMAFIHVPSFSLLNMCMMTAGDIKFILKWSEAISEMLYLFQLKSSSIMGSNPKHGIRNMTFYIQKCSFWSLGLYATLTILPSCVQSAFGRVNILGPWMNCTCTCQDYTKTCWAWIVVILRQGPLLECHSFGCLALYQRYEYNNQVCL